MEQSKAGRSSEATCLPELFLTITLVPAWPQGVAGTPMFWATLETIKVVGLFQNKDIQLAPSMG